MKKSNFFLILGILCLLFIFSIACKQSGEIITPAEATQRYVETQAADIEDVAGDVTGAVFSPGATAQLTATAYLVGIFKNAGDNVAITYATRGDQVTVVGSIELGDEIWYKIETTAGDGWVPEENLEAVE